MPRKSAAKRLTDKRRHANRARSRAADLRGLPPIAEYGDERTNRYELWLVAILIPFALVTGAVVFDERVTPLPEPIHGWIQYNVAGE